MLAHGCADGRRDRRFRKPQVWISSLEIEHNALVGNSTRNAPRSFAELALLRRRRSRRDTTECEAPGRGLGHWWGISTCPPS